MLYNIKISHTDLIHLNCTMYINLPQSVFRRVYFTGDDFSTVNDHLFPGFVLYGILPLPKYSYDLLSCSLIKE